VRASAPSDSRVVPSPAIRSQARSATRPTCPDRRGGFDRFLQIMNSASRVATQELRDVGPQDLPRQGHSFLMIFDVYRIASSSIVRPLERAISWSATI
jgi:hypothetical protein